MASYYVPLPRYDPGPQGINFEPLSRGISKLSEGIKENRLLDQSKQIGSAIQSGDYSGGAAKAFEYGDLDTGLNLANTQRQIEQDQFNRNRLLASDRRAAAAEGRAAQSHELTMQKTRDDLRTNLITRTAGIAERIRNEADPARKQQLMNAFVNAHPRLKSQFQAYNLDPANPDPVLDMIIAEAQGLTKDKYQFTKYGVGNTSTGEIQPYAQGSAPATREKPPTGYRYSQDGQSLEAIPGGPATKLPGDMSGRVAAIQTAKESFENARKFYEGQDLGDRTSQLINSGEAGRVERNVRLAIEAALRAMTGAAAPDSEVENYLNIFGPSAFDSQATIKDKLDRLQSFMANVEANIAQGRGAAPGAQPQPAQPSPFPEYPNAQQAPDGNWYVEQNGQYFRIDQ